jgi:hypothetical protein
MCRSVIVSSTLVPTSPAFLTFHPTQYLRPFDRLMIH